MPTLVQTRNAVDAALANLWPHLVDRQEARLARKGRYVQFLATANLQALPNVLPADPTPAAIPTAITFPSDEAEAPPIIDLNLPTTLPCVARCDVYEAPAGQAFFARVWVKWNGNVYTRAKGYGPGAPPDDAWRVLDAEEVAALAAWVFDLGNPL